MSPRARGSGLRRQPPPRSQERPLRDLWLSLVSHDLALVWRVQDAVRGWPRWVHSTLARLVSHHPLRDVSVVTWFAFLLGCRQFGFHFFWACCANLLCAGLLRLLLSAPRPFMYDQRLRPLTDRYETSHGLPSLETHMATVVAGWWAESGGRRWGGHVEEGVQPLFRLFAVSYIFFVGFTRVYACSRFVHQVLLSIVSGVVGLSLGWRFSTHLDGLGLLVKHHVRGTIAVAIIALGVVAYHIENNDSQLGGIKKQEYLRVLANIVKESRQAQSAMVGATESDGGGDSVWEMERDAPWDGRVTSTIHRRRRLEERRDSFYFLQKTVERRSSENASVHRATSTGFSSFGAGGGRICDERLNKDRTRRGAKPQRDGNGGRFFAAAERSWGISVD